MIADTQNDPELQFKHCIKALISQFSDLSWDDEDIYATWLAQTYFFVRHVTSLVSLAASRFGPDRRNLQYAQHKGVREEMDHDLLLLNDLAFLMRNILDFREFPETSAFYHCQYYYVEHESPIALIGASLSLEGLSAAVGDISGRLKKTFGTKAVSFISHHVTADKIHFRQSFEQIKLLKDSEQKIVMKNVIQSPRLYSLMLTAVAQASGTRDITKKTG